MAKDKDWSKAPIVVITGLIASCIAIFVFVTGKNNIPEVLKISTSTPAIFSPAPTSLIYPTETEVSAPTLLPSLDGSPSSWLPSSEDIPSEMNYANSGSTSNEDVAKQYDNPTETFNNLKEWGRITGYYQQYLNRDGCNSTSGLREIYLQTILYKDILGAQKSLEWGMSKDGNTQNISGVGEIGYYYWSDDKSGCETPDNLKYVDMVFRRLNVIGVVYIGSIDGTLSDEDMLALATKLGKLIDLKLVASIGN